MPRRDAEFRNKYVGLKKELLSELMRLIVECNDFNMAANLVIIGQRVQSQYELTVGRDWSVIRSCIIKLKRQLIKRPRAIDLGNMINILQHIYPMIRVDKDTNGLSYANFVRTKQTTQEAQGQE